MSGDAQTTDNQPMADATQATISDVQWERRWAAAGAADPINVRHPVAVAQSETEWMHDTHGEVVRLAIEGFLGAAAEACVDDAEWLFLQRLREGVKKEAVHAR